MAFQQYFMQEWKPLPSSPTYPDKPTPCFDCNICLDFARDPVVTLCGHLYCWPCIYKWLDSQTTSFPSGKFPQCPVCKSETSEKTLIPLYGRGQSNPEPQHEETVTIPPRPPAMQNLALLMNKDLNQNSRRFPNDGYNGVGDSDPPLSYLRVPMVEMLGGMVYDREFGNSTSVYSYPNSYRAFGSNTVRLRRRERRAAKSLNRVSIFLFCCLVWCLFLF